MAIYRYTPADTLPTAPQVMEIQPPQTTTRTQLTYELEQAEASIQQTNASIAERLSLVEEYNTRAEAWLDAVETVREQRPTIQEMLGLNESMFLRMAELLVGEYHFQKGTAEQQQDMIERYRQYLRNYESVAANARRQLATFTEATPITLRQPDLERMLANYNATNIHMVDDRRNGQQIIYTMKNLWMTVHGTTDTWTWIKNINENEFDDDLLHIPLPPVHVVINLTDQFVRFLPEPKLMKAYPVGGSGRNQAHPHVTLPNGQACLGDFNGPFHEAIHDRDFPLMFQIIKMFLEQANARDPVGRQFYRWAAPDLFRNRRNAWLDIGDSYARIDGLYHFVLIDKLGTPSVLTNVQNEWPALTIEPAARYPLPEVTLTDTAKNIEVLDEMMRGDYAFPENGDDFVEYNNPENRDDDEEYDEAEGY